MNKKKNHFNGYKQLEDKIREDKISYRFLAENIRDVIWTVSMDLKYTYISPSISYLQGFTPEEMINKTIKNFFTLHSYTYALKILEEELLREKQKNIDLNRSRTLEFEIFHKDRHTIWVESKMTFIRDKNDKPIGILGITRDISERKKQEQDLKKLVEDRTTEIQLANIQLQQEIVERKEIETKLGNTVTELQKVMIDIVNIITVVLETKEPYISGHQKKVSELACKIAKEMNLEEKQIIDIQIAGLIHDIGKICIPAEILNKPSSLSQIEFEMVKTHVNVGYDILKKINFSSIASQIVLQHHERLSGKGYPNNLAGENILLEAKILAVADVVEAMSSHRSYRDALHIDKVLEEISKNKDILYDTNVVNTCIDIFKKGKFQFT